MNRLPANFPLITHLVSETWLPWLVFAVLFLMDLLMGFPV